MSVFLSLLPAALMVLVAALHALALAAPSSGLPSIFHYLVYWFVFMTPFTAAAAMRKAGRDTNVLSIYAAHKHLPAPLGTLAYVLLAVSLLLMVASLQADFNALRRSTALWLCLLSCPSVVWWYFKSQVTKSGSELSDA